MRAWNFLARWFAIKRLEAELRLLRDQVGRQLAEVDRLHAEIRDMRCPKCGERKLPCE